MATVLGSAMLILAYFKYIVPLRIKFIVFPLHFILFCFIEGLLCARHCAVFINRDTSLFLYFLFISEL